MSELRAFVARKIDDGSCDPVPCIEVYLKSEADKFISNLKESHKKEVEQLLIEIAELKEAQRWRKYSEEKPSSDGYYIICGASGFRNADRFMECKDGRGMDFSFYSYGAKYWMPMPKMPDGLKEAK